MRDRFAAVLIPVIAIAGCASNAIRTATPTVPLPLARAQSDRLNDMRQDAKGGADNAASGRKAWKELPAERKENSSGCNNDSLTNRFFGPMFLNTVAAPFTLPQALLNDDLDHVTEFPDFPYADGQTGSLLINTGFKGTKQAWTGTLQTFAVQGNDNVDRFGGRLLLDSDFRFGIDTETNYWTESLSGGRNDQLWTGDANLVYRFVESEHFQWRAGVGVNWLTSPPKPEFGVNLTYGVEWFPIRPWTISSVIDVGTLGSGGLFHNRTTVGIMLGPVEAFAGYDYFQLDSIRFHGPVAGVGYRF